MHSGSKHLTTTTNASPWAQMEAGKALDIVRTEVDLAELVGDVHLIIEAMIGRQAEVRGLVASALGEKVPSQVHPCAQ